MPASSPTARRHRLRRHRLLRPAPALLAALLLSGLGACGPAYRAAAQPSAGPAAAPGSTTAEADPRRLLGTWALTSSSNELFNLLLRPDGKAMAALGSQAEGDGPAERSQLMEVGRWRGWGNGLRVDFSNGWTDAILIAPEGPIQWSWKPGSDRGGAPTSFGRAVRLADGAMAWVGLYRFVPTQPDKPAYVASLLSSGQAYNDIDAISGGSWRQEPGRLVIDWASGWRTTVEAQRAPEPAQVLRVLHWAPGRDRNGPPSAERGGERL